MFIHFINDIKFVDFLIDNFEKVDPNNHKYVFIITKPFDANYIKNKSSIIFIKYRSIEFYTLIKNLNNFQAVFLHFLDKPNYQVLLKASNSVNFVWMIWGGDFYGILSPDKYNTLDDKTHRFIYYIRKKNLWRYSFRIFNITNIKKLLNFFYKDKNRYHIFNKIKFYTTVLPNEKLIVEKHLNITAKYLPFNYASIESLFNFNPENYFISGNKVLVGNSANASNNHISIIDYLSNKNLQGRQIIFPLSYGIDKIYLENLLEYGKLKLGKNFIPILNFLEKQQYLKLVSECSVSIMNHHRQQAMGNILMTLWLGSKLFLSTRNPAFHFLKNMGIKVFSIERDLNSDTMSLEALEENEVFNNRNILKNYFSQEKVLERTKRLLMTINKY